MNWQKLKGLLAGGVARLKGGFIISRLEVIEWKV